MRSSMLLTVAALALSAAGTASVQAADMPRPAPQPYVQPYIAPVYSWTGFYVGGTLGYAFGKSNWTGGAGDFSVSPNGFVGGGTLGYNWQTSAYVWGLEGDLSYANLKGSGTSAVCATCTIKDTWLATFRGRLGYSMGNWMPYVTGGGAWANVYVASPNGSTTGTKGGWTAGAGVEWTWGGPWSAKAEYLYVNLGDASCTQAACQFPADAKVAFTANIIRAGINYRF